MIVIYTTGSSFIVDVEESAFRAQLTISAGIRNWAVESRLSPQIPIFDAQSVPAAILALPFLVPLFTPSDRQSAAREAKALGFSSAFTLIDPTALLPRAVGFGAGSYVNAGCVLGSHSAFGEFTLLNRACTIGHHACFADFVSVGPGAVIAGNVTVGKGAVIGAGAVVLPEITIGANAVVGAGSVVTRDVLADSRVQGNPARIIERDIAGFKGKSVE